MKEPGYIVTYEEMAAVPNGENGEKMVNLKEKFPDIAVQYEQFDMLPFTGNDVFVRELVAAKLNAANEILKKMGSYRLKVVYGYRHPSIQELYFEKRRQKLAEIHPEMPPAELDRLTHNFVAIPSVAGHPAGAAVDLTITTPNGDLDMGTKIGGATESDRIKTFSDEISESQKKNRLTLCKAMIAQGFAPFYGEWWHFSYGDREWAAFYEKPSSLYSTVEFKK